MRALANADRIRLARAELKRRVAVGDQDARDLLFDLPPYAENMKVADLIESIPRVGPVKRGKIMRELQIHEQASLGALSFTRRLQISAKLTWPSR